MGTILFQVVLRFMEVESLFYETFGCENRDKGKKAETIRNMTKMICVDNEYYSLGKKIVTGLEIGKWYDGIIRGGPSKPKAFFVIIGPDHFPSPCRYPIEIFMTSSDWREKQINTIIYV